MIVTLSRDRYLHVETGTIIHSEGCDPLMIVYHRGQVLRGHDAEVAREAIDELLRRQDAETAALRFGIAKSDCGPRPVTGASYTREPEVAITVDDVGYEPDPRD